MYLQKEKVSKYFINCLVPIIKVLLGSGQDGAMKMPCGCEFSLVFKALYSSYVIITHTILFVTPTHMPVR